MNLQLPDAILGDVFAALVLRPFMGAQAWPPTQADWPDQAVDACAPEGAYPSGMERLVPYATHVLS